MRGIIICQPYANLILRGVKKEEYRTWNTSIINEEIYLLSEREIIGIIKFTGTRKRGKKYAFRIKVVKKFKRKRLYHHPLGAVRWINPVQIVRRNP